MKDVVLICSNHANKVRCLFSLGIDSKVVVKEATNINAYLVAGSNVIITSQSKVQDERSLMEWGNKPTDGGHLTLSTTERLKIESEDIRSTKFIRPYYGAAEYIRGLNRFCIWVADKEEQEAREIIELRERFEKVRFFRASSKAAETRPAANFPHRFRQIQSVAKRHTIIASRICSERREYLSVGILDSLDSNVIISDQAFALYDAPLWNMALIASRLHWVWITTVCGKLETRYRYSTPLAGTPSPCPP